MSKQKKGCFIRLMGGVNLLLVVATLLAFVAPYFPPTNFWPFIFIGLAFPVLVLFNIIFFLFWLYQRSKYFLFSFVCLLVSWNAVGKFLPNPFMEKINPSNGTEIVVATFNTQGGRIAKEDTHDKLKEQVLSWEADIVCFQEFRYMKDKSRPLLDAYPYSAKRWGQLILSKYPITGEGDLELEKKKSDNGAHWADIEVEGQSIRIFNLHLNSNNITNKLKRLNENNIETEEQLGRTREILAMIKNSTKKRSSQAHAVAAAVKASPHPVILAGDFNDPPQSYTYRIISEGLRDAFVYSGKGLGFTYNEMIPFLKIDYCMASPDIPSIQSQVMPTQLSDHKPILTRFVLPIK